MNPETEKWREEVRARLEKATPGPWEWTWHPTHHDDVLALEQSASPVDILLCTIAHAPDDLRRLLALVTEQAEEIEKLRGCPWCGAEMECIPDDGGEELGCTSDKCSSFGIGVWF